MHQEQWLRLPPITTWWWAGRLSSLWELLLQIDLEGICTKLEEQQTLRRVDVRARGPVCGCGGGSLVAGGMDSSRLGVKIDNKIKLIKLPGCKGAPSHSTLM